MFLGSLSIFDDFQSALTVMFTIFGIFATMTTKIIRIEIILATILDYTGFVPTKAVRTSLLFLICLAAAILSLLFTCPTCYIVQISLETNVAPAAATIVVLAELLVVCGCYGTRRLISNVSTMTSGKTAGQTVSTMDYYVQAFINILWIGVIPVVLTVVVCVFISLKGTTWERIDYVATAVFLCPIPICAIYRVLYYTSRKMNWRRLFTPDTELWGPRSSAHRALAEKNERRFRL